jgi:hypothetical protein
MIAKIMKKLKGVKCIEVEPDGTVLEIPIRGYVMAMPIIKVGGKNIEYVDVKFDGVKLNIKLMPTTEIKKSKKVDVEYEILYIEK